MDEHFGMGIPRVNETRPTPSRIRRGGDGRQPDVQRTILLGQTGGRSRESGARRVARFSLKSNRLSSDPALLIVGLVADAPQRSSCPR